MQTSILYFDQFELDLNSYELRKSGRVIKLEKLPMELLILLAESQGQLVTREQIIQRLWGDNVFVDTRQGINTAIRKLRIALHDDSENPRLLQTIPGRGYRLLAPVSRPGSAPDQEEATVQPPVASSIETAPANAVADRGKKRMHWMAMTAALLFGLAAISWVALLIYQRSHTSAGSRNAWIKVTNFPDSATQPALSPDGHMIAFIRGLETFVTPGEIYVKILPDGEPVQLTHDGLPKMAPAFSPDGSRIAYTATDRSFGWNTWIVPVLGGEPRELLPNAAALTWVDRQHVMFSEIKTRVHMSIVTATESRAAERNIYLPPTPDGMAHRSWISPDGKWILVSEMDPPSGWLPCRVLPFDGSTSGKAVGPNAARCTYAGWSPDGRTMYFSADAGDGFHIWRQHFPNGEPEQMTFGPTEEEGIAVSPDGRTLVTSAGIRESAVWLHDAHGDRQISGEGFATVPGLGMGSEKVCSIFSPDGKKLYYVARKEESRSWVSGELWMADLDSGRSELILPGISINTVYSISPDGNHVTFAANDTKGESRVWIAPLDRSSAPEELTGSTAQVPSSESARVSPDGQWKLLGVPIFAQPVSGGTSVSICDWCSAGWGPEGKYFYLRLRDVGEQGGGKTYVLRLPEGKDLPDLPPGGVKSAEDVKALSNLVAEIDMSGMAIFAPGTDPSVYAYTRVTVQRNLYRIPLQ